MHAADRHEAALSVQKEGECYQRTRRTKIFFVRVPYLQYEQILLTKNFRQYLETIMLSSKVLRMGIQKTPYQKTCQQQAGSQEFTVAFQGCDRQFDWLEISLLYDKSDKYLTIYDSYNAEYAARMIKKIELSNISDVYSAINMMKFNISNDTQKHLLWKQYVAWHCNGYTEKNKIQKKTKGKNI